MPAQAVNPAPLAQGALASVTPFGRKKRIRLPSATSPKAAPPGSTVDALPPPVGATPTRVLDEKNT